MRKEDYKVLPVLAGTLVEDAIGIVARPIKEARPSHKAIGVGLGAAVVWNFFHREDGETISEGFQSIAQASMLGGLMVDVLTGHWKGDFRRKSLDPIHIAFEVVKKV